MKVFDSMPSLHYEHLDPSKKSIRLLTVYPGKAGEMIRCHLAHADLDERPAYISLSYTWNRGGGHGTIECCGVLIQVGKNLWDFLNRYREWNATRNMRLWIDAICINQNDVHERNHQVAQMRDVYSTAQSAIAWLGEATRDEGTAFHLASNTLHHSNDEGPGPMAALLNKPYWSRVWIVQEFLLARSLELWCGPHRANATHFSSILNHVDPNNDPESLRVWDSPGRKMLQYRDYWQRHNTNASYAHYFRLRALVRSFSSSACSERYDRVYALLGIARDATEHPNPIEPDYDKPGVHVLLDVLRNQSGKRLPEDPEENRFIELLRTSLGVSRVELARSILEAKRDIEPHIFVLATGIQPVAQLRLIGCVTEWRSLKLGERLSPADRVTFGSLAPREHMDVLESFNYYRWHRSENEPFLADTIARAGKMLLERVVQVPEPTTTKCDNDTTTKTSLLANPPHTAPLIPSLTTSFLLAATHATRTMHAHPPLWDTGEKDYKLFTGTHGLRGIVHSRVRLLPDLQVAFFTSGSNGGSHAPPPLPRNALLLQTFGKGDWYVAGVAHILAHSLEADHGLESSTPLAASWRSTLHAFLPHRASRSSHPHNTHSTSTEKRVCLKYDTLLGLLDLCRCEVLDEQQLGRVLADSIQREEEEPGHDCNRVEGPCSTLHLHPAL